MPPSEITATSVVPPPMSTIMLPAGSCTGSPAPIAAAIGSSITSAGLRAPGVLGRLLHRALLDAGDARRDADDHAGLRPLALVHPLDEVAEHLLADVEVGDDAVLQRADRPRCARACDRSCASPRCRPRAGGRRACSSRRPTARRARCRGRARRRACSRCRDRRPCRGRRRTENQGSGTVRRSPDGARVCDGRHRAQSTG